MSGRFPHQGISYCRIGYRVIQKMGIKAATSSSLSASGSSSLPTVVTWFRRRARNPSSQSVAVACQRFVDDRDDVAAEVRANLAGRRNRLLDDGLEHLEPRLALEQPATGEQLEQHDAQREHV